jgi:hypothetical protein
MIGAVGLGIFLGVARSDVSDKLQRDQRTMDTLVRAKQALIDYAVQYDKTHSGQAAGFLPCPDMNASNGEGSSPLSCDLTNVSVIGKFPWRTLDVEDLRDGSGECLWYAVSGTFKNNPKTNAFPLNWDATGLFEIFADDGVTKLAGTTPADRAVAVIFAPGIAQGNTQARAGALSTPTCGGGDYDASHYLEAAAGINNWSVSNVAGALTSFIQGKESNTFNDRLVYITPKDIFDSIERRADFYAKPNGIVRTMMKQAADCIASRANKNTSAGDALVWAADSASFGSLQDFDNNSMYSDTSQQRFGRVSFDITKSIANTNVSGPPVNPKQLMIAANCDSDWNDWSGWWAEWKDHFFYAVAKDQAPDSDGDCSVHSSCLSINNGTPKYAGIVIFAGRPLPGQTRSLAADRQVRSNYLEGNNQSVIPGSGPANAIINNVETHDDPRHATLNDLTYCILSDPLSTPHVSSASCP